MMLEFSVVCSVILFFTLVCLITRLYGQCKAFEWFTDHERKFKKHFNGEGIHSFVYVRLGKASFHFHANGKSYNIELPLAEAKTVYDKTQGGGIRKVLLPLTK